MAETRITVLVEDTAGGRGLLGEHGLAFWIEAGGGKVLFDTGQGLALGPNARRLGIPLEEAEAVLFSHGHYDHTGGAGLMLGLADRLAVYAHPDCFVPKFARDHDGAAREVGAPPMLVERIAERGDMIPVVEPTRLGGGLRLTGPIPRRHEFEDTGGDFHLDRACTRVDGLEDDQAAFIEGGEGTLVILGCAHAGVINTLYYIRELTGGRPIHTVLGGMHLLHASPERLERTVTELRRLAPRRLLPCHCTGFAATARLAREFPGIFAPCPTGTVVEFA